MPEVQRMSAQASPPKPVHGQPSVFTILLDADGRTVGHDLGSYENTPIPRLMGRDDWGKVGHVVRILTPTERHEFRLDDADAPSLYCYCGHSQFSHDGDGCNGEDCDVNEGRPCAKYNWSEELDLREILEEV